MSDIENILKEYWIEDSVFQWVQQWEKQLQCPRDFEKELKLIFKNKENITKQQKNLNKQIRASCIPLLSSQPAKTVISPKHTILRGACVRTNRPSSMNNLILQSKNPNTLSIVSSVVST